MPLHGPLACTRCWSNRTERVQECGTFRLVRDPGHWGAADPHTLVLGISKGNTQSQAFSSERFENVGFKGIRDRMLQSFQAVGLLHDESAKRFDQRFSADERDFAFASVVRCSITGMHKTKGIHTADSPNVVPAFKRGSAGYAFVKNCVDEFIAPLSSRTRLVLLLGNSDAYVSALADVVEQVRGPLTWVNQLSYDCRGIRFVHVAHPSKGNGHFGAFLRGEGTPGLKRELARDAIKPLVALTK